MWNNGGVLSATDTRGVQAYYGHPDGLSMRKAAVNLGENKFYFFRGSLYTRVDGDDRVMDSGYPRSIASNRGNWPASWDDGIDAAINWDDTTAYFFRGSQYVRVDIPSKTVVNGYPKTTATFWGNWPAGWTSVDAAVDWGNGKYYFFRGDEYVRYDSATDRVESGYPKLISDHWGGLFSSGIDSAFNDGDGKAYFFNGYVYDRVDIDDGEHDVDQGYPVNIVGNWPGVLF